MLERNDEQLSIKFFKLSLMATKEALNCPWVPATGTHGFVLHGLQPASSLAPGISGPKQTTCPCNREPSAFFMLEKNDEQLSIKFFKLPRKV